MKKFTLLFILNLSLLTFNSQNLKAQYVTIPDANFVTWLTTNYPSCMNGNQMDTTCSGIVNATYAYINIGANSLSGIQYFDNLTQLYSLNNNLGTLPPLPNSLSYLQCTSNNLTSISSLPNNLLYFYCGYNQLTSLPALPASLSLLHCVENQLTSLPTLPSSLHVLKCTGNQLTTLPALPNFMGVLECSQNQLTNLPALPDSLNYLNCDTNNISCFPPFSTYISYIQLDANPFTCLPNYIPSMSTNSLLKPLCVSTDLVNNPNGCIEGSTTGIIGMVYKDNNNNCAYDVNDVPIQNVGVKLFDTNNILMAETYTLSNGFYSFSAVNGTYIIVIDTLNKPYKVTCQYPGIDSTVTLSTTNSLALNINFAVACKPGFDIGVASINSFNNFRPGQSTWLRISIRDFALFNNLNCLSGISGQVTVNITGPVKYVVNPNGSVPFSYTQNQVVFNVSNFTTNSYWDNSFYYFLLLETDTTAQLGNQICINVSVTPTAGDYNLSNNNYIQCFTVVNSHDPNDKMVDSTNVLPGYQNWLNYTIRFQNTGNAPAINIKLLDSLNTNLDLNTFEVVNGSHQNTVYLSNNVLQFRFPNIQLPDSTTDSRGSNGFIQYRIKPKANLAIGTIIPNKAYIYFDYNAPIITNAVTTTFNGLPPNQPSAFINYTDTLCAGTNNVLFNVANDANATYTWSYSGSGATITPNGNAASINFSSNATSGILAITPSNINGSGTARSMAIVVNQLPTAQSISAMGNTTFCAGNSLILMGNLGGTWSSGATTADITVTQTGNYSVTTTNSCGSVTSNEIAVTVNSLPIAQTILAMGSTTFCEGNSVMLMGNTGGTWSSGATIADITVTQTGNYSVTTTNSCGSVTSNTIAVTVNPLPTAATISAMGSTTFCQGNSVMLMGNTGGTWSSGGTSAIINVNQTGNYFVTTTNNCGIDTSNIIVVTVNTLPTAAAISAMGNTTFCEGNSLLLMGNTGGTWSSGGTSASINVNQTGNYFVTTTNNCGSVASNTIAVTVNPLPTAATISTIGNTTFCEGSTVMLMGNIGGTWSSGGTAASINVNQTGNYFVTTTNNCGSVVSNTITVTVNSVDTSVTVGNDTLFANAINASYQWLQCNGNYIAISGDTNQTFTPTQLPASYAVVVTQNSCVDTSACYPIIITSLPNQDKEGAFILIPNPATSQLIVDNGQLKIGTITIQNTLGEIVYTKTNCNTIETIDASGFSKGVYFVLVNKKSLKFVKE